MTAPNFSPPTSAWLARGRHLDFRGRRVFVVDQGTGPAVLLLHGFPTSGHDWREVADRLRSDFRPVVLDFLGFGLSDKPDDTGYSLFDQADLVEEVARQLGIDRAHVASHDMGTSVHCELLAREQAGRLGFEVIRSTFLNGSMLQWLAAITPFQELLASNATLPQAMELCATLPEIYVPGLLAIMRHPERISADDQTVLRELLAYRDGHLRLPALAGYMRERYIHRDRWLGALGQARGPVQFVWADGDPIANQAMGQELHRMYPQHGYRELADLGHFLLMEDPPQVAEAIRDWIGG